MVGSPAEVRRWRQRGGGLRLNEGREEHAKLRGMCEMIVGSCEGCVGGKRKMLWDSQQ